MYYLCTVKIIGRLKDVAATSGIFLGNDILVGYKSV
jgi:hypothetical protein